MDLSFNLQDLSISIPIFTGLLSFLIYWFSFKSEKIRIYFISKYGQEQGQANFILFTRYLGGACMGLIPALSYYLFIPAVSMEELGLIFKMDRMYAFIISAILLLLLIIPMVYSNSKKPENLFVYPQIRKPEWNRKLVMQYFFSWAWYLLGYEILFRGILLFPLSQNLGLWPAIAINIALYSATHIPKGYKETLGAIPLSLVLCLLCLYTGSFWLAFIAHLAMAWTNTWFSLKHNPNMTILKLN